MSARRSGCDAADVLAAKGGVAEEGAVAEGVVAADVVAADVIAAADVIVASAATHLWVNNVRDLTNFSAAAIALLLPTPYFLPSMKSF